MSVPPDRLVPGASPESSLVSSPDAVSRPPRTDRVVFGVAAGLVLAIVLWGLLDTGSFDRITADVLDWIVVELGWLYVLAASAFVFFVLWLALSKYGRIPLGQDGEKP
ncbi:BCCT family transporter, partial [Nocardia sp. NPDC050793]